MDSVEELRESLQRLEASGFEKFVANLWEQVGWNTRVTNSGQDRGIDVIATRRDPVTQKHLIQVKRYSEDNKVTVRHIQQYASLPQQDRNSDAVVVVTSGEFTDPAERRANQLNVKLVGPKDIFDILQKYEISGLLSSDERASQETTLTSSEFKSESPNSDHNIQIESSISAEEKRKRIEKLLKRHKRDSNNHYAPVNLYFISEEMPPSNQAYYVISQDLHQLIVRDREMADRVIKIGRGSGMEVVEDIEHSDTNTVVIEKSELPLDLYTDFHINMIERLLREIYDISFGDILNAEIDVSGGAISWSDIEL